VLFRILQIILVSELTYSRKATTKKAAPKRKAATTRRKNVIWLK